MRDHIVRLAFRAGLVLLAFHAACTKAPEVSEFFDGFDRARLGEGWADTGGRFRIESGHLMASRAYNHPLWLTYRLPRDVEISFDAWSKSRAGDVKVEVFGDGESRPARKGPYTGTGYLLTFGGWKNTWTVLARMNEHGPDRLARSDLKVVPGRKYRWRIVRKGRNLSWWIDGRLVFELDDPDPLEGPGREHFGFNNWEAESGFDNLFIRAR